MIFSPVYTVSNDFSFLCVNLTLFSHMYIIISKNFLPFISIASKRVWVFRLKILRHILQISHIIRHIYNVQANWFFFLKCTQYHLTDFLPFFSKLSMRAGDFCATERRLLCYKNLSTLSKTRCSYVIVINFFMKNPLLWCPYLVENRQFSQNYPIA